MERVEGSEQIRKNGTTVRTLTLWEQTQACPQPGYSRQPLRRAGGKCWGHLFLGPDMAQSLLAFTLAVEVLAFLLQLIPEFSSPSSWVLLRLLPAK